MSKDVKNVEIDFIANCNTFDPDNILPHCNFKNGGETQVGGTIQS